MNDKEIIKVEHCIKDYHLDGQVVHALRGVNLTLHKGEFAAIAGPSGSGKTTLLNCIGGLDYPTKGSVHIEGTDISKLSSKELSRLRLFKIGFIFQAYNLIPVLTVRENVEYILLLQGMGDSYQKEKAAEVLTLVGLQNEMHRFPHELSGGQQQRVAIARAIVANPAIVLADEPTANVDQKTAASLLDVMEHLNKEKQITFLFSTHDPMVMKRARRLIQIADGVIVKDRMIKKKNKI
ncbi:MAG: ABC transporter ATP-binding protein [Spirochaetes bacterium]|nr:ABC transporter ATP-binding protein [Spirochaetota bacterium]